MTVLVADSIEKFKEYSNFRDLKDFNNNIEMFLAEHKAEFTKSEYMLFRRLTKYCAKVAGVANASIKTLLAGAKLKDFILGASESTFHRMKRKAIKLGILEVHTVIRKNESQSSNLWVFKRFSSKPVTADNCVKKEYSDTPQTEGEQVEVAPQQQKVFKQLTPLKTRVISKTKLINNIKTRIQDVPEINQQLDYSFVPEYIPKEFTNTVKPFFDSADAIVKLWHSSTTAVKRTAGLEFPEIAIDIIIRAFKETVYQYKKRKIRKEFNGYYYGVLCNKLKYRLQELTPAVESKYFYNWLEIRD
ncbi:hypothetical protein CSV75_15910 [Sporosarcina sp. P18a]|uniref:hypothetical protein n=1 Tax=Sporosarcina sp. P18a TaxID=2048259 RepID=UPI000C16829C|nr:hypothetical protein [Sporosarcina sp. P18a]PIC78627.1 hypothetical protein CSV75_15910 [Sporosarcina sp. P18a]